MNPRKFTKEFIELEDVILNEYGLNCNHFLARKRLNTFWLNLIKKHIWDKNLFDLYIEWVMIDYSHPLLLDF
jgi:hypothetical protein